MRRTQLLKGVLPTMVLSAIHGGDVYGYRIVQRLRDAGLGEVGDASVYGTLQRLYSDGLVSAHLDPSGNGPPRKCYSLTAGGLAALTSGREEWMSFQSAVHALVAEDQEPAR